MSLRFSQKQNANPILKLSFWRSIQKLCSLCLSLGEKLWFDLTDHWSHYSGFKSLYQGFDTTLMRNMPGRRSDSYLWFEELFYIFLPTRRYWRWCLLDLKLLYLLRKSLWLEVQLVMDIEFINTHESGALYWTFIFPIGNECWKCDSVDMVKTRRQTDAILTKDRKYGGTLDTFKKVYHSEGMKAFYKGFGYK